MVGDVGYTHKRAGGTITRRGDGVFHYHKGEMASLFVPKPSESRPAAGTRYNWGALYGSTREKDARRPRWLSVFDAKLIGADLRNLNEAISVRRK